MKDIKENGFLELSENELAQVAGGVVDNHYPIGVDSGNCIQCGYCVLECASGAITNDSNGYPEINRDYCNGCGHCIDGCPTLAIIG